MAVQLNSRYRGLTPYTARAADGTDHATVPARPLPPSTDGVPFRYTVVAGDTLEALAYRFLGSSRAWWQIADANPTTFPLDLVPGSTIALPTGRSAGLVVRSRTF
jgi:nucleoid-associated protein YgaU